MGNEVKASVRSSCSLAQASSRLQKTAYCSEAGTDGGGAVLLAAKFNFGKANGEQKKLPLQVKLSAAGQAGSIAVTVRAGHVSLSNAGLRAIKTILSA